MIQKKYFFLPMIFLLTIAFSNCNGSKESRELIKNANAIFGVIPNKMPGSEKDDENKIALGKKLFFDTALSVDNTVACNTCHNLEDNGNGTDNKPHSIGVNGKLGGRNAPTVWNAGFHIAQFWDGRAKDLEEQAKGPILNPVEMAMPSAAKVVEKLKKDKDYVEMFKKAFPKAQSSLTFDNLASAIAAFERTLITTDRLDQFQNGDTKALTQEEQEGLKLFMDKGCTGCHNGPLLGGNAYQKLGLVNPYPDNKDKGRYNITHDKDDMYVFKVSPLRNVADTSPYFHDGSAENLHDAVKVMAWHQLGLKLPEDEINKIATFLKALSKK